MRILVAGTPEPAAIALRELLSSQHDIVGVLTRPDAPRGRGRTLHPSPVAAVADEAGIPALKFNKIDDDAQAAITDLAPDCIAVIAYGALVPESALQIAPHGWVNLHFSLLPRWRGASPVNAALRAGDTESGVSTFQIEAGLDTGDVLLQQAHPISFSDTADSLLTDLTYLGAKVLVTTMDGLADGSITPTAQNDDEATYAGKISTDDCRIDWSQSALQIHNFIRAISPRPGAWSMLGDDRIKLGPFARVIDGSDATDPHTRDEAGIPADPASLPAGSLMVAKQAVWIVTGDGLGELTTIQAPGKKAMPAADWARGARINTGEKFQ